MNEIAISRLRRIGLSAAVSILVTIWLWITGDLTHPTVVLCDSLLGVLAVAVASGIIIGRKRDRVMALRLVAALTGLYVTLSLTSSLTVLRLPSDPTRFSRIQAAKSLAPITRQWQDLRVGLALSGGGYRAAVFHSGVLQALERMGIKVSNLSTVSGGSIIGAYYAVGGDPRDFVEAVADGRFGLKRQLFQFQNAIRLLLTDTNRLDIQEELLHRLLFSRAKLTGGIAQDDGKFGQPELMVLATDLAYGFQVGLLPAGFLLRGDMHAIPFYASKEMHPISSFPLAARVAVSGAFPIAFPARRIAWRSGDDANVTYEFVLVDGGIRDNSGSDMARFANDFSRAPFSTLHDWSLDALLVSDGGAAVGVSETNLDSLQLLSRVFDVASIGKETSGEEKRIRSYRTCREPIDLPTDFAPPVIRPEEGYPGDRLSWHIYVDLAQYPHPIVRELIEALPSEEGVKATQIADRFFLIRRTSDISKAALSEDVHRVIRDRKRPQRESEDLSLAIEFEGVLHKRLEHDLEVFRSTSTLADTLSPESVSAVERLGKMLVYLNWPHIERELDLATQCADHYGESTAR